MPAQRKRAGKRPRARKSSGARVISLALDMEVPLNEAIDAVQALRFIGYGLTQNGGDEEGSAVGGHRVDCLPAARCFAGDLEQAVQGGKGQRHVMNSPEWRPNTGFRNCPV